jgi:UDP-N-acetyl-D-galactosamine dehydrogenase
VKGARVGVFGLTFKENVADIRNSKVPDILKELKEFGIDAKLTDPYADPAETKHEYGLGLTKLEEMRDLDALILAVSHSQYVGQPLSFLLERIKPGGVLVDVKSAINPAEIPAGRVSYWCL